MFASKIISQTVEVEHGEYVYHFVTNENGETLIKRTKATDRLWGHGVLVQSVPFDEDRFAPMNCCGMLRKWNSLADAYLFVADYPTA
jgi:hypothetical protein